MTIINNAMIAILKNTMAASGTPVMKWMAPRAFHSMMNDVDGRLKHSIYYYPADTVVDSLLTQL